jgi:UDP-N-acetylglucosamine 2-epimerase (non-hydrolysing)
MRVLVPFGTRPEIVKLSPVVTAFRDAGDQVVTVATGQHEDPLLAASFFADLAIEPDVRHELPAGDGPRMGALVEHAYADVATHAPEVVVALGDTNTVPAYALAARRAGVPLAHLEAGLRSFNPRSLEEVNRAIAAATASLQLAPTPLAAAFLRHEGQDDARVHVVGNPVTDVLRRLAPPPPRLGERDGVLVTAHRATNVDDPERLARLVAIVERLATAVTPVRFPVHPRTQDRLSSAGLLDRLTRTPGLQLEAPLRYPEMLAAIAVARVVVTDSGGLQEEAAWFGVPVVVLRTSTPRWEGVVTGSTRLVGLDADRALAAATELVTPSEQERIAAIPCPYGDGHVGPRVVRTVHEAFAAGLLDLAEPQLTSALPRAVADALQHTP